MNHIRVIKAAHHMDDRVYLPDLLERKLISQTFTFGSSLYQTCNIYELNGCRCDLLCIVHLTQNIQSVIRYGHNSHIRVKWYRTDSLRILLRLLSTN